MAAEAAHLQDHIQPKHFLLSFKKKKKIFFWFTVELVNNFY